MSDFFDNPPAADAGLFGVNLDTASDEIIIVGVPWEPTASYGRGTSKTPRAMIPASHQLDFFSPSLGRTFVEPIGMLPINENWETLNEVCITAANPVIAGEISGAEAANILTEVNTASARLNEELLLEVRKLLAAGKIVGILGGDHSSPFGSIQAHFERFPEMGILHIDAHHDLREAYEGFTWSHASIMYNVVRWVPTVPSLVSVGIRDYSEPEAAFAADHQAIHTFYDRDLKRAAFQGETWGKTCERILEKLPQQVYVSFDIDGLDPKLCPNTGTPVPGGLGFDEAVYLMETLVDSGRRIVGFDLCEVGPNSENQEDEWDLNVGARLLHALCVNAWRSHPNQQGA